MRHGANKMKKLYLINDICVCCGAPVVEGTMVCQRCLDSTEKEHKLWQEESTKRMSIVMEQKKKAYQKPEMAFVDMEKRTVTGSPEMVSRISPKIDRVIQEIACENSIEQTKAKKA